MPFPFTFKLSAPGMLNPFTSANAMPPIPAPLLSEALDRMPKHLAGDSEPLATRRRPSPAGSASPVPPISRKRGWEPSFAEPSLSATTLASSSGYLDTPAKYRDMARGSHDDFHEIEEMAASDTELPPPAKRRRGLAGSIVSTAFSAALIGTAVGLTVYRLWRDRGKEPEQIAPPPYQQGAWTPISDSSSTSKAAEQPKAIHVTPPTPRGRKSRAAGSLGKRTVGQVGHRKTRSRVLPHPVSSPQNNAAPVFFPPPQSEFKFTPPEEDTGVVEDQMDWIGDKLSMLIEEGKKALGREVVVMSETKEDEVDDGTGTWEEEDPDHLSAAGPSSYISRSLSRSNSPKRARRPRNLALAPSSYATPPPSASPRSTRFDVSAPMSIPRSTTAVPVTPPSAASSLGFRSYEEDARSWESPELRETMERARAAVLRSRGL